MKKHKVPFVLCFSRIIQSKTVIMIRYSLKKSFFPILSLFTGRLSGVKWHPDEHGVIGFDCRNRKWSVPPSWLELSGLSQRLTTSTRPSLQVHPGRHVSKGCGDLSGRERQHERPEADHRQADRLLHLRHAGRRRLLQHHCGEFCAFSVCVRA